MIDHHFPSFHLARTCISGAGVDVSIVVAWVSRKAFPPGLCGRGVSCFLTCKTHFLLRGPTACSHGLKACSPGLDAGVFLGWVAWSLEEDCSIILVGHAESHVRGKVTIALQSSIQDGVFRSSMHSVTYLLSHHVRFFFPIRDLTIISITKEKFSPIVVIGWFEHNGKIMGGTGWSVEMAKAQGIPTFIDNLTFGEWWQWRNDKQCWYQCEGLSEDLTEPPFLYDKTAIVGTRQTNELIEPELRQIFHIYDNPPNLF